MPTVKLVAPDGGDRIVPVMSQFGLPDLVKHGAPVDVPVELAGEAPRWRRLGEAETDPFHPDNDPQAWASGHHEVREHAGHTEIYDLGTGLLAQVGIWELVTTTSKDAD